MGYTRLATQAHAAEFLVQLLLKPPNYLVVAIWLRL
jgi:hypothetical protein